MGKLHFLDRAFSGVAPGFALKRAMARHALVNFEKGPASLRGKPASAFDQGSSETWSKQRERITAIWEGREMEEKFCLVGGILERLAQYTVGTLEYHAQTGDEKADREYEDYFHDWCGRADYTGRHRFRVLSELGLRAMWREGEHGWIEHIEKGELRLQSIESDRIGNPHSPSQNETNIGGVLIDDKGRVTAYEIYKRTRTVQYTKEGEVKPAAFVHLFRPTRSDQYHGVSLLKPVLPHARDLYELLGFEKVAAKFAASFAAFIRTQDPYAPPGTQGSTWDAGTDPKNPTMAARAGTVVRMTQGEQVDFAPGTMRPSGAFIALVEAIIREIAIGLNLPYGFIYNMASFGGVTARLETQQAERVFRRFRELLVDTLLERVKRKVLLFGIASKAIRATKDWNKGGWQFGSSLTGDVGNQVQADATLVQYGVKTRTRWAAELGGDFDNLVDEAAGEIEKIMRVSKQKGIPMELLIQSLPNPTELIANLQRAKRGETDSPPPPPGLIGTVGDKGVKTLIDLLTSVGKGEIDPESARWTLMTGWGMDALQAQQLVPTGEG